ncbi:polyprenyl synthetase family protein [Allostreptomyces psammosilenae]
MAPGATGPEAVTGPDDGGGPVAVSADRPPVPALLNEARALCLPLLRAAVSALAAPMDAVAAYHFGWTDAAGNPASGDGGKAVRPALAVLSARAAGAGAASGAPAGVAVELVHNFSLLHDDLMDGDEQRRHRDTAWKVFGPAQAVLVGDALFAAAFQVLHEHGGPHAAAAVARLTTASRDLITGQAQDLSFEARGNVGLAECLEMEGNKTSSLLACASSLGAVLAGAPAPLVEALARYGHHLGLAFQAVDDLLGIWGEPEVTGKPNWSDLRRGKKSLPVVAALGSGLPQAAELARMFDTGAVTSEEDGPARAAALVEEAGGRDWAAAEADRRFAAALEALDGTEMDPGARASLRDLAEFVVRRSS